ncbi:MAG TPA: ABC transporter substrate-binding protein [Tepidisphaeraceae bacterium]|nr:ABC transporter substrate-binding protein [Tepidisphaeraceae bacterium]
MPRSLLILLPLAILIALPFALRPAREESTWRDGDPVLVVVTPHNEAIRYEFGQAFSRWHHEKYGKPVKIDWRVPGGTTEIMRYLASEYGAAVRAWWIGPQKNPWPAGGAELLIGRPPADPAAKDLYDAFRATDDPNAFSTRIDLLFGGGEFDHSTAFRQGLTVPPWKPGAEPSGLFTEPQLAATQRVADGTAHQSVPDTSQSAIPTPQSEILIPAQLSGETWRTPTLFGNVLSTFGLCYNTDRLDDLRRSRNRPDLRAPARWDDLADPAYFAQIGACDPSKSGSVAKAFEMIIHQKMRDTVVAAGFDDATITKYEKLIADHQSAQGPKYKRGDLPPTVPPEYQSAVERGWLAGVRLVQLIGANARYFTDSAQKVPIDVSAGDAAVGMCIDFYGRYQAQSSAPADGRPRMVFVTPAGGSSVSCDPISLLRGAGGGAPTPEARAERRQIAIRFIEFTLSEAGQKLWCYKPGEPGGPKKFALRRVPVRRDFYPSTNPTFHARHVEHNKRSTDDLASPNIDPYQIAQTFTYYKRWTADHFNVHRDLIRVMCMDAGDELREAWHAIITAGGPPTDVPLTWRTAPDIPRNYDRLDYTREWTAAFRAQYKRAAGN